MKRLIPSKLKNAQTLQNVQSFETERDHYWQHYLFIPVYVFMLVFLFTHCADCIYSVWVFFFIHFIDCINAVLVMLYNFVAALFQFFKLSEDVVVSSAVAVPPAVVAEWEYGPKTPAEFDYFVRKVIKFGLPDVTDSWMKQLKEVHDIYRADRSKLYLNFGNVSDCYEYRKLLKNFLFWYKAWQIYPSSPYAAHMAIKSLEDIKDFDSAFRKTHVSVGLELFTPPDVNLCLAVIPDDW